MKTATLRWNTLAVVAVYLLTQLYCLAANVPPTTAPAPTWEVRTILPSDTDSSIDTFSGDGWAHCVYFNPDVPKKNLLVVFLAGTNGKGNGAKSFNSVAANEGFHVVSLAYPSTISISTLHNSSDPDAFLKARENIIYGTAPYETLKITEPNSIQNRLIKLLQYLDKTYPKQGWKQYLTDDGSLEWSKLILAGQSQGGGHAALIAIQHQVARVVMFGSPKDFNIHFDQPAKWYSIPSKTPIDRFFSFVHADDDHNGCTYPEQLENYKALNLMPRYAVINVDDTPLPYEHTRLLTSKIPSQMAHGAPIKNEIYMPAWKYMLEEPIGKEN